MNLVPPEKPSPLSSQTSTWALFSFAGRDGRGSWWIVQSLAFIVFIIALNWIVPGDSRDSTQAGVDDLSPIRSVLLLIAFIVFGWIGWASHVRRMHDHGKPGERVLVGLIPIIGAVWLVVYLGLLPGMNGPNEYGYG